MESAFLSNFLFTYLLYIMTSPFRLNKLVILSQVHIQTESKKGGGCISMTQAPIGYRCKMYQ